MNESQVPLQLVIGQVVIFLTTIVSVIVTLIKDKRQRAWVVADREATERSQAALRKAQLEEIVALAEAKARALAIEVESKANALRVEAFATAERLRMETLQVAERLHDESKQERSQADRARQVLHDAIRDVKHETEKTGMRAEAAYQEANNSTMKMNQLVAMFNQVQAANSDKQIERLDHVINTGEDTGERVKDIQQRVKATKENGS